MFYIFRFFKNIIRYLTIKVKLLIKYNILLSNSYFCLYGEINIPLFNATYTITIASHQLNYFNAYYFIRFFLKQDIVIIDFLCTASNNYF